MLAVKDRGLEDVGQDQGQQCRHEGKSPIERNHPQNPASDEAAGLEPPLSRHSDHDETGDHEEQDHAKPSQPAIGKRLFGQWIEQCVRSQDQNGGTGSEGLNTGDLA